MITRKDVALLSVVGMLALSATLAQAQSPTTGRIEGIVKDQNGAVIVGAVVSLLRVSTSSGTISSISEKSTRSST